MKRAIAFAGIGIAGAGAAFAQVGGRTDVAVMVFVGLVIAVGGSYASGWEDAKRLFEGLVNMVRRG